MNKATYTDLPSKELSSGVLKGTQHFEDYELTPTSHTYLNGPTKRILDITVACLGVLFGLPIVITAAIIIKLVDQVPVVFSQQRYGYGGREFTLHKLQTLKPVDARKAVLLENIQNKPAYETTRIGKVWRVTSIDEILQFWSMLTGEMSLIGYRPVPMYYLNHLAKLDGMNQRRLAHYLKVISCYKPGLSSLSSVNGRGDLTMQAKMEYDLIYAQNASLLFDIKLLLQTITAVFNRRGAI
jgi:lipopolysaccharide/colanic/teichoic acid biosynthesis glycosyltransferase